MDEAENSDEVISGRNIIMIYLLNSASKKMPIKERDIIYDTETKSTFKKSFEMAKEVLKEVILYIVIHIKLHTNNYFILFLGFRHLCYECSKFQGV